MNFSKLAGYEKLVPYLKKIDNSKIYSNFGPLYKLATKKIENHLKLKNFNAILTSSGDSSLNAIFKFIKYKHPKKKIVICPSFAFHSDINSILNNQFIPYFVDINKYDLTLDDTLLKKIISKNKNKIAAILFVSPFGYPISSKKINSVYNQYKIPIVYDAADTFLNLKISSLNKNVLVACSFHPTKTFPGNESGLILSNKRNNVIFKDIINHGINSEISKNKVFGFNGKASEYDSAILLANFDEIKKNKIRFKKINLFFKNSLNQKFFFQPNYSKWISNKIIFFTKINKNKIIKLFNKFNIKIFKIWREKCLHEIKQFKSQYKTNMSNSLYYKKLNYSFFIDERFNQGFIKKLCKELNKV